MCGLGNGVDAARMKRVAAAQSPGAQPDATQHAMFFYGFTGVAGTRRVKSAVRAQERADKALVKAHRLVRNPGYCSHCIIRCQCVLRDWLINLLSCDFICRCANTTMSSPDNISAWLRKLSRMVRLTLFLDTAAFTAFLEIARPSRAYVLPFLRARIINCESRERQDVLKTLLKSAALFSLCFRWRRRRSGDTDEPAYLTR